MKQTYITTLPDRSGAFLAASRIISGIGGNITRVSYNKAVDTHTLFLDVSGTEAQLERIGAALAREGYIRRGSDDTRVLLLSFRLKDVPGAVVPILELIERYAFNISYISSLGDGSGVQDFKMGLFVEDPARVSRFLEEAARLCPVRAIDYDEGEQVLDNTIFYLGFANRMAQKLGLDDDRAQEVILQANRIMQTMGDRQEPATRTFEYINGFVDALVGHRGEAFEPRLSRYRLSDGFTLTCIEPPCGSSVWVLEKDGALLFVDSGYPCYAAEMRALLRRLFPGFDGREKRIAITHPDIDHCGLLDWFDTVYLTRDAWEHFRLENAGEPNFRERNPLHAPYVRLTRLFTGYRPPRMETLRVVGGAPDDGSPLCFAGSFDFHGRRFDVYRGNGGHAPGECAIVDEADRLVFSGDIIVNAAGFTRPQAEFNSLAPYLMTSVNMNSSKAVQERLRLRKRFSPDRYRYCCGHGALLAPEGDAPEAIAD